MWEMLKGSPIVARLLSLSKSTSATGETKSKIIRIVTNLSKEAPPMPPPENIPKRSKYEDVNIRLYSDGQKDEPAYVPAARPYEIAPRSRGTASRSKLEESESNKYSFDPEKRRSKYSKPFSEKESSLRKVGYSAIHDKPREPTFDYDQMEEGKRDFIDHETPINSYSRQINKNSYEKPKHKFDDDYKFPLDGGARRDPMVKIPFNDNLLHDY